MSLHELLDVSPEGQAEIFTQAAQEQGGILPVIIEKDFWVCWLLKLLFEAPLIPGMVFKGGTSLSKSYRAIQRFSEDVDLTLPRLSVPGADAVVLESGMTRTARERATGALKTALRAWCDAQAHGELSSRIAKALGGPSPTSWRLEQANDSADTIQFTYPRRLPAVEYQLAGYIKPTVVLEFGVTNPTDPSESTQIQPYCATAGLWRMAAPAFAVETLTIERTLWEKATLVHSLNQRGFGAGTAARRSRHYADLVQVARHPRAKEALRHLELLRRVADEKDLYFYSPTSRYPLAYQGKLALTPSAADTSVIAKDYDDMKQMYFGEPEPFASILEGLRALEEEVNRRAMT